MNVYLSPEAVRNLQEIRDKHLSLGYSNAPEQAFLLKRSLTFQLICNTSFPIQTT